MSEPLAFEERFRVLVRGQKLLDQASEAAIRDLVRTEENIKIFWGNVFTPRYEAKLNHD